MEMKALEDLFIQELCELWDAEQQIIKALPKMAKAAQANELRAAFELHLKQTNRQAERLEKIFKALGREPESKDSDPISEIIKQGETLISAKQTESAVLDAALITAAQKVEHYEIATYGSARSHARMLGYGKIADLLEDTLEEEEETDALLTKLATKRVNIDAVKAPYARARTTPRFGEEQGGRNFGGLLMGVLIGAAVALLYAPKSGEKIRQDLRDRANDLRARGDDLRASAEDLIDRGKQTIQEQRSRLMDTVEAGREAFRNRTAR